MYDYELEKSLEERQKEELELKLKINQRNRKYEKKQKIGYIIIRVLFILSVILGLIIRNIFAFVGLIWASYLISAVIMRYLATCPHCDSELIIRDSRNFTSIDNRVCPFCNTRLSSTESLTAIEEKRKKENSAKKDE